MTGCGKYGALNSVYVEKLSTSLLSNFYSDNNLATILNEEPFWKKY